MNPVDKQLKRLTIEKYVGQGIIATAPLMLLDSSMLMVNLIVALVFIFMGFIMWMSSDQTRESLYSLYKLDLSIWYLLERTEFKITDQHCYQIIKNTNIALDYKMIPLIEPIKDENYMDFLNQIVADRYSRIMFPFSEEDVHWIRDVLPFSREFLSQKERDIIENKLKFYSY